jgi:hypothetical protein
MAVTQLDMRTAISILLAVYVLSTAGCAQPDATEALVMSNGVIVIHTRYSSGGSMQNTFYSVRPGAKDYVRLRERLKDMPAGRWIFLGHPSGKVGGDF